MPTRTYHNLNPRKKERIEQAIKKEFARVPIISMSVKNIVSDACIARGSFYQYFESRDDVISYMIQKEADEQKDRYMNILNEKGGDLFEASYECLVQDIEKQEKDREYYINIFDYLQKNKITQTGKIDAQNVERNLNEREYNVNFNSSKEVNAVVRVIATITLAKEMDVLDGVIAKDQALKEYREELEILKKGIVKRYVM